MGQVGAQRRGSFFKAASMKQVTQADSDPEGQDGGPGFDWGVLRGACLEDCGRKNAPRAAGPQEGAARSRRGRSWPFHTPGEMDRQAAGLSRRKLRDSGAGPGQAGILRGHGTGRWMLSLLGMKRKRASLRTCVQGKGGHRGVCARGVPRRELVRPATGSWPARSDGHVSGSTG